MTDRPGAAVDQVERVAGGKRSVSANMKLFIGWVVFALVAWLVIVISGNHWSTVFDHWQIAATMVFGSYVGGSTPLGGGTVAFPVLVLLLDEPATVGRDFALAIQSVGLTTASIFILCRRQQVEWSVLYPAIVGSALATPCGIWLLMPSVSDAGIKLAFSILVASFGTIHLWKGSAITARDNVYAANTQFNNVVGLVAGVIGGGLFAATLGIGANIAIYIALVLLVRADVRAAIPTAVMLMAFTSLIGFGMRFLLSLTGESHFALHPEVYANWLAAVPVVVIGAAAGRLRCVGHPSGLLARLHLRAVPCAVRVDARSPWRGSRPHCDCVVRARCGNAGLYTSLHAGRVASEREATRSGLIHALNHANVLATIAPRAEPPEDVEHGMKRRQDQEDKRRRGEREEEQGKQRDRQDDEEDRDCRPQHPRWMRCCIAPGTRGLLGSPGCKAPCPLTLSHDRL